MYRTQTLHVWVYKLKSYINNFMAIIVYCKSKGKHEKFQIPPQRGS